MSDDTTYTGPMPDDVPPATSPGGTVADEYLRRAASGPSARGKSKGQRPPRDAPRAPADSSDDDLTRPLTPTERTLRESILELYTGAQVFAHMADPMTGELIREQKEACADAWVILARRDARVKAMLKRLTTGSAWGAVLMAHIPIVLPLLMRKGILPGGALFGGAPFNSMQGVGSDGGSQTDDWPFDVSLFNGTVGFGGNGSAG